MKVIIAGGRHFNDYDLLKRKCDYYLSNKTDPIEIVSGHCPTGADAQGERYAQERGYALTLFPADWATHGCAAGPIRNKQMADYADALIAFWDRESAGTGNMITLARGNGLRVKVVRY